MGELVTTLGCGHVSAQVTLQVIISPSFNDEVVHVLFTAPAMSLPFFCHIYIVFVHPVTAAVNVAGESTVTVVPGVTDVVTVGVVTGAVCILTVTVSL